MTKFSSKKNIPALLGLVLLTSIFLYCYYFTIPAEDAVILFDYAKNLASTGIITFGNAGYPIEGATDFLWMIFIAGIKLFGLDEFFSALFLNLIGGIFLINVIRGYSYKLIAIIALFFTPYLYSSLSGFSTILFSAIYVYAVLLTLNKDNNLYLCILLLCLVRPDGVIWGSGLILWRLAEEWNTENFWPEIKTATLMLIIPGLLYFIWRAWYFNEFLPLPFLVKSSGHRNLILFHSKSLKYIAYVLLPFIISRLFSGGIKKRDVYFFILPVLFYGMMRLEQNIGNRFIAPMFFASILILSYEKIIKPYYIFTILSIIVSYKLTLETITDLALSRFENGYYIARDLSRFNGRMLITEAGRLTYYSNWLAHDSWGLNTPEFTHKPIREKDVNEGNYDLIVAHCNLTMLNVDADLTPSSDRSWDNQCKALVSSIRNRKYTVMLVPFNNLNSTPKEIFKTSFGISSIKKTETCKRHDIYAISPGYRDADKVMDLLKLHGAIAFSPEVKRQGHEEVCRPVIP